jgi:carbon monoxide dehydrogenase subunit G
MPEVAFTTEMALPLDTVWAFVSDMNNWAPFLTGYQKHEVIDATDSLWTLKGEVGILSRRVELRAHVTEWLEPQRVTFTLTGINEDVDGGGTLVLRRASPASPAAAAPSPRVGLMRRVLNALARLLFRLTHRSVTPAELPAARAAGEGVAMEFTLRMDAGGPAGPLVNAMLGPALEPAVEDLAKKIAAHLSASADARHA